MKERERRERGEMDEEERETMSGGGILGERQRVECRMSSSSSCAAKGCRGDEKGTHTNCPGRQKGLVCGNENQNGNGKSKMKFRDSGQTPNTHSIE